MINKDNYKLLAQNKKAYHDYFVDEKYEAGLVLTGTEIKSLRLAKVNLKDSYCSFYENELFTRNIHISPYEKGNIFNKDPMRERKLLLHRKEINKLFSLVSKQGYTLIPLKIYLKGSLAKLEIGLCRGKKLYDKRASEAERSAKRQMDRFMKIKNQ